MTRIPDVSPDEAGPLIKLSYWYTRRRFGEVPEPFAVTANHRKLFVAYLSAKTVAGKASTVLPANVRDLAVYRVAWMVGCSWCVNFDTMLHRLKEIGDYATSPVYTDDERGHRLRRRHDRNADGGDRRAGRRPGAAVRARMFSCAKNHCRSPSSWEQRSLANAIHPEQGTDGLSTNLTRL